PRCASSACSPPRGLRSARPAPGRPSGAQPSRRSEEHTSELQSLRHLVCRLLLEKKKKTRKPGAATRQIQITPARSRTPSREDTASDANIPGSITQRYISYHASHEAAIKLPLSNK